MALKLSSTIGKQNIWNSVATKSGARGVKGAGCRLEQTPKLEILVDMNNCCQHLLPSDLFLWRFDMSRVKLFTQFLAVGMLSFVTDSIRAGMVNGTIFTDEFNGASLDSIWTQDGSPEVDPTSSLT